MYIKRNSRVTADVTLEAHNLLRDACLKYDCGKGKLLERMIRNFCGDTSATTESKALAKVKAPKAQRKQVSYPDNLDDQFLLLWETKGKKGPKQKAYDIYRKMSADVDNETCQAFTEILMKDMFTKKHEPGYPERHLTSYLNGKFWEE